MDQYSKYENLPRLLKRFSFEEKMKMATIQSCKSIAFNNNMKKGLDKIGIFPWVLETFVMLSMEAKEHTNGNFQYKNENKFFKMCNAIWDATSVILERQCGKFSAADIIFTGSALTQFHLQESSVIKLYRFWRIFSDNTEPTKLEEVFKKKTGAEYDDFLMLGYVLKTLFLVQSENNYRIKQKTLHYLLEIKFKNVSDYFLISRENYVKMQKHFTYESDDIYKYTYSLCPSYQYVLVENDGKIYFPLPHLIDQCITSSLLCRITEKDNHLRNQIGKNILENYLFDIIKDSNVYDEVYKEQTYKKRGREAKSPDVLTRQNDDILLVDSKSTIPNIGIRLFDPDGFDKNINIVAENVSKLYKQIEMFDKYNPFKDCVSCGNKNIWGLVIVLEDAYINRKYYYEKAKEKLGIEDDMKFNWLISHIKVVSLYEVESVCLQGGSLIEAIKNGYVNNPYNFTFSDYKLETNGFINEDFKTFKNDLEKKTHYIFEEMNELKVLV